MPEQSQAEIPQDAVAKFHALTPEQRETAISRMTPELKSRFLPAAQEYKAMHAPDSAYPQTPGSQPMPGKAGQVMDKVASFLTRNAPTIGGAVGGVMGSVGGPAGSAAGAAAGGAYGSAIRQKAQTGAVSGKEVGKDAAIQGAIDLGGGLAGKGILKAAKVLGVDDAIMKFALKRGEDFERDLNPAALMNRYHLHAMTTKELYQQASQKIGTLSKTADAILDEVSPYSSTIRPYAVVKGVVDKYIERANKVGDPEIADSMKSMLKNVGKEFGGNDASKLLTSKEANQLKQVWGDSVQWGKEPPKDSMQAAFKTVQNARRDIYHALNESIADAMGGNQGKLWKSTNHDIFNLMEAKGALQEAGERTASDARGILPTVLDAMRKPGPASMVGQGVRNVADNLSKPGVISNIGRAGSMSADAMFGQQNPIPVAAK
jgi:hypothetical protein